MPSKMKGDAQCAIQLKKPALAGPSTPVPSWKLYDNPFYHNNHNNSNQKQQQQQQQQQMPLLLCGKQHETGRPVAVSARKLAAALWELQRPACHRALQCVDAGNGKGCLVSVKSGSYGHPLRPQDGVTPCNGSFPRADSAMRSGEITPGDPTTSEDLFRVYNRIKVLEEEHSSSVSLVQALRRELDLARGRVQQLELAQKASRRELESVMKKMVEERVLWRSREQESVRLAVQTVTEELNGERKIRRKLEILNKKLSKQLSEAKLAVTKSLQELEKERKGRELLEDVCNELAKEIGEDKAELEELKKESARFKEEAEEERRMLRLAEVWREERVQMKLTDARHVLEEKRLILDKLRSELEDFLGSRMKSGGRFSVVDVQQAELLRDAASSIRNQDIRELSCEPAASTSDEGFLSNGDLHSTEANNGASEDRTLKYYLANALQHSPAKQALDNSVGSPELHSICITPSSGYSKVNTVKDERRGEEEEVWDSASDQGSNGEEGSSDSHQESEDGEERAVDFRRGSEEQYGGEANYTTSHCQSDTEDNDRDATVVSGLESHSGQLRKEESLAECLLRTKPGQGEFSKSIPMETGFPNPARHSVSSLESVAHRDCSPSNLSMRSSPDICNPHITRGIRGFIEWPRGIRQSSLKARLLEAKVESQKAQLRQSLKQKNLKG